MVSNPLFATDFYKVDHRRQYPEGTTEVYSNFTPRYVIPNKNLTSNFDNKVVVFGIQYFIHNFLIKQWNEGFFMRPKKEVIWEYKELICHSLNLDDFDVSHLEALHDLRYLPIEIRALEEGKRIPIGIPMLTIRNTLPEFFWLTNYLETAISASLWKPMTVATIAFEFKRLLTKYALETGVPLNFVPYQAHDFSFRGMSCLEDAAICGAAHLTSFEGTDSISAIPLVNYHYRADETCLSVGSSVPATEHSVMTCTGVEGEFQTIKRLITEVYPDGIVSIVSDSYDFWNVVCNYLPSLHPEIAKRNGKIVIRPDSGNPYDIICGDISAAVGTPDLKGALQILWETFGGRVNDAGFKELNSKIGLIYGDAITVDVAERILSCITARGFASSNIVFGVGSFSYQYLTRDTFGFAMKATSAVINGERVAIYKDPKTGSKKKSAKGLLFVSQHEETWEYKLNEDVPEWIEQNSLLVPVFRNGDIINSTTLAQIRDNLACEFDN